VTEIIEFLNARLDHDERFTYNPALMRVAGAGLSDLVKRARVDISAKRRIVALHSAEPGQHPDFCGHDLRELPCPTLRLLASVYSDHPDYREEWRP